MGYLSRQKEKKGIRQMSKKFYPPDVVEQAQDVLVGWLQANGTLAFGTLNSAALTADVTAAAPMEAEISKLEKQLADKRNQRDVLYLGIWDKVKRVRSGVKANYGDDSQQYEMVGGKRLSDRKSPRRTASPVE
jgi:hypothetical protein